MNIKYEDKTLKIDDKAISFLRPIEKIISMPDGVIVLLESYGDVPQNIYWVNIDGKIRWQIEHIGTQNAMYVGLEINKDGILEVNNVTGYICKVNHENGKLYDCRYEDDNMFS